MHQVLLYYLVAIDKGRRETQLAAEKAAEHASEEVSRLGGAVADIDASRRLDTEWQLAAWELCGPQLKLELPETSERVRHCETAIEEQLSLYSRAVYNIEWIVSPSASIHSAEVVDICSRAIPALQDGMGALWEYNNMLYTFAYDDFERNNEAASMEESQQQPTPLSHDAAVIPEEPDDTAERIAFLRTQLLGEMTVAVTRISDTRDELSSLVNSARRIGITWREIGDAVGTTPQSALRRWDDKAREKHNDYRRRPTDPGATS